MVLRVHTACRSLVSSSSALYTSMKLKQAQTGIIQLAMLVQPCCQVGNTRLLANRPIVAVHPE